MSGVPSWLDTYRPEVLCLSSGALKGLEELGAIYYFGLNGNLANIHTYIGSSIGGIIGAFLALDYSLSQILEAAVETTLFNDIADINLTQVIHEFGLVSNTTFDDNLARRITQMVTHKMGKMPTLREFYEFTKKRVIFCIVSLKNEEEIYADHLSHPDMPLMVALRSTSNSPLLFGKLEHQKDLYVDGAILDPFPVLKLDDGKTQILAIGVKDHHREWNHKTLNGLGYYDRIVSLPLQRLIDFTIANASDACYIMMIPVANGMGMLDGAKNPNARLDKFLAGYKFTEEYVVRNPMKSSQGIKTNDLMPLSKAVVNASLQSHAAKVLLRCVKENPDLFEQCMKEAGIDNPFVKLRPSQPEMPVASVVPKHEDVQMSIIPVGSIEPTVPDDDILEIPRLSSRRERPSYAEHPFEHLFHRGFPIPRSIHIEININEELLDQVFRFMLGSVRGLGMGSLGALRKL